VVVLGAGRLLRITTGSDSYLISPAWPASSRIPPVVNMKAAAIVSTAAAALLGEVTEPQEFGRTDWSTRLTGERSTRRWQSSLI